ncbi:Nucleolar complex-associated protein 3 [Fusarium oxysporum f. sp. vasinfectum]|nr:Nucleolar complex-associated protein 3 [Fusarium oxysporum f. sp. vasinfectum]
MAQNGTKRRKIAHDSADHETQDQNDSRSAQKSFFKNASNWNLEQDYETRPRKGKKQKESNRLPIKTADGRIEQAEEPQQILAAQEELAKIAMQMNENPEEHVGAFKALAKIGQSKIIAIQMLALMTQMSVYKDIIPGYRIRPQTDNGPKEKLSKEVRTLRQYEQALVSGYQNYIKELARCSKLEVRAAKDGQSLATIAITCACTLVTSVPHFNFRIDLLKILVTKLSRRKINQDGVKCLEALQTLFKEDEEGRPTNDAVALLSKMMKAREFQVDESVVNLFLSLRLLSEFSGKASRDHVENDDAPLKRKKKEFRTKRHRKALKEQKALDKDMANADASVSHEERDRMQSETLKLVFATYFRILKLRMPHLMGAVLEGLAKYAHLINQDFFGDLLEALKDLIRHSEEDATEAYALLEGQDAHNSRNDLHLDLSFFTTHLFKSLLTLSTNPDVELTRPANTTNATTKINVQTTTVLLLRALTGILLPPWNIRSVPPMRLAAFSKQLMTAALQLPDKSCQAVLVLLSDVAHTHSKKVRSLWNTEERKGDGRYNPVSDSVEGSNPFTATVWEGELLRKHYSPKVREGVKILEKGMSE